jgi:hypothetical protein
VQDALYAASSALDLVLVSVYLNGFSFRYTETSHGHSEALLLAAIGSNRSEKHTSMDIPPEPCSDYQEWATRKSGVDFTSFFPQ